MGIAKENASGERYRKQIPLAHWSPKARIVFDGTPEALTEDVVIDLYGLEANDVLDLPEAAARQSSGSAAFDSAA